MKVETHEQFQQLKNLPFDLFQGYFFSRPDIVSGRAISSSQVALLDLVGRIYNPEIELKELGELIRRDVALSHKILKFINCPLNGLRTEVESIHQAVVLLGLDTIRNWVTVLALAAASNKTEELSMLSLVRARCCELMARCCSFDNTDSYFMVGLFSSLDAMMDQPMDILVAELPLSQAVKEALLNRAGELGEALEATVAMEKGDFALIGFGELGMGELSDVYLDAINWSEEIRQLI